MSEGNNEQRPRSPGFVYGTMTLAIGLVLAVIALTARQPPPPTIAEFAPQAQERIEDAPDEQSSRFGSGDVPVCDPSLVDCEDPEDEEETAAPTPTPIIESRAKPCAGGDPPKQIEDPQSPPCIPYWDADNGGATWQGVTRDEVRIVIPSNTKFMPHFEAFFNANFQFYGRKLRLIDMDVGWAADPQDQLAFAAEADEEHQAFASAMYGDAAGTEFIYYDELARRGIVSVNGRPTAYGEAHLRSKHPYQWSYLPGHDEMSRNKAEWACSALKGKTADFAGGSLAVQERVFGLVVGVTSEGMKPDIGPMMRTLERCGITLGVEPQQFKRSENDDEGFAQALSIVSNMREEGVTSIFCQCHTRDLGYFLYYTATTQGYEPEWLASTFMYIAEDAHAQAWEPSQVAHTFGLSWWSKQLPAEESPWFWAIREYDPGYPKGNPGDYIQARWLYNGLLMLASGIQMAGPTLTPETFAKGLQETRFPNPKAGEPPYWQAEVGFQGDHTAVNDATLMWLSSSERSNWGGQRGAMCHAARGKRYSSGGWPSDYAGLFEGSCY